MHHLLTIADAIATHARLRPAKIGARDSTRALTFSDWHDRSTRLANALLDRGLQKGDRVALLAYNCIEWAELYVALARAGLVAVPLNFRLTGEEILYIITHNDAAAVIAQAGELADKVDAVRDALAGTERTFVQFGAPQLDGWLSYESLIAAASASLPAVEVGPTDPCALMYTSGTTGRPKGAIRSHEGSSLLALATAVEMGLTRDDTALLVMPMCHANSLYFATTFMHLGACCSIDDSKSFDPASLLRKLATEKITFTSLVPTHFIMMLALPEAVKAAHDVSAVGKLLISSAPARRETKLAILDYFKNGELFELYGSTEAGWVTLLRPEDQLEKLGSVGREWAGSGAIRLFDPDGNEVADGEVGELFSRTPYVFEGYWNNPEKTAEAFRGKWCSVGDLARRDSDGYIHLVDRKSNMIITGGENVYPSEVESVLGAHPKIRDIAVIGLPHEKWGEAVHAVIVLHQGEQASEAEILTWCKDRIAGYKRPRSISFMQESQMPRTATGKILYRVLRDQLSVPEAALSVDT